MKKYNEIHHQIGMDGNGKRAWLGPRIVGQRSLDDKTAESLNAQFDNSGIKFELAEEGEASATTGTGPGNANVTKQAVHATTATIKHMVTQDDVDADPTLAEKLGQMIDIPSPASLGELS